MSRAEPRAARRAERLRTTRAAGLVMGLGLAAAAPLARPDVLALAEAHVAEELGATLIGGGTRCAEPRALRVGADRQVERQELQNLSLLALGGQRGWDLAATWQQQSLWLLQHSGHRTSRPFPERVVRVSCQLRRRRHAWRATKGGQAWFSLRCPRRATGAPPTTRRRPTTGRGASRWPGRHQADTPCGVRVRVGYCRVAATAWSASCSPCAGGLAATATARRATAAHSSAPWGLRTSIRCRRPAAAR